MIAGILRVIFFSNFYYLSAKSNLFFLCLHSWCNCFVIHNNHALCYSPHLASSVAPLHLQLNTSTFVPISPQRCFNLFCNPYKALTKQFTVRLWARTFSTVGFSFDKKLFTKMRPKNGIVELVDLRWTAHGSGKTALRPDDGIHPRVSAPRGEGRARV